MNGREVEWNEKELELTWALTDPQIAMWMAGYGPHALAVAGRVGDGVIIQLADPEIVEWIMDTARNRPSSRAVIRTRSSATSARRVTSRTTWQRHASRSGGSRRWCRTT